MVELCVINWAWTFVRVPSCTIQYWWWSRLIFSCITRLVDGIRGLLDWLNAQPKLTDIHRGKKQKARYQSCKYSACNVLLSDSQLQVNFGVDRRFVCSLKAISRTWKSGRLSSQHWQRNKAPKMKYLHPLDRFVHSKYNVTSHVLFSKSSY